MTGPGAVAPISTTEDRMRVVVSGPAGTAVIAAAILALLMARLLVVGSLSAVPALASIYVLIGAGSLAASVPRRRGALLDPGAVLVAGLVAVALVAALRTPLVPRSAGFVAVAMNTLAAVSEEAFFRRFLYGRLERLPVVAVAVSAIAFAAIHVPVYGLAVFWVDLGAGVLFGWQRWASGTWTVPAATHAAANLVAVIR